MKIRNTYAIENAEERKERQAEIHRRCILLLRAVKEAKLTR